MYSFVSKAIAFINYRNIRDVFVSLETYSLFQNSLLRVTIPLAWRLSHLLQGVHCLGEFINDFPFSFLLVERTTLCERHETWRASVLLKHIVPKSLTSEALGEIFGFF